MQAHDDLFKRQVVMNADIKFIFGSKLLVLTYTVLDSIYYYLVYSMYYYM